MTDPTINYVLLILNPSLGLRHVFSDLGCPMLNLHRLPEKAVQRPLAARTA